MKKLLVVLWLAAVLAPSAAYCEQSKIGSLLDKILGRAKTTSSTLEQSVKPGKKVNYIIRLRNGGKIKTDNYTVLRNSIRIILPSGAIVISKGEIRDIQVVNSDEVGTTVQKSFARTPGSGGAAKKEELVPAPAPANPAAPGYNTDNYGHNRFWWKARINNWKKKYRKAAEKYKEASDDWSRYNGLLTTVSPTSISDYQVTEYQDMRGAARVRMDDAQKEMDKAQNMINNVIPDEARKDGAPPGWVR